MDEQLKSHVEHAIRLGRAGGFAGIALDLEKALNKNALTQIHLDNAQYVAREECQPELAAQLQAVRLDGLDARLTDYVIHDGGDFGQGKCLVTAKEAMPTRGRHLSKRALLYRISENTVFEDGRFRRKNGEPSPVLVDINTGLPVPVTY